MPSKKGKVVRARKDANPVFNVKDFSLRLTFESGQPLAFYGDYSSKGKDETLSYVTRRGLIEVRCSNSGGYSRISCRHSGDYTDDSAREDAFWRLGMGQDMGRIYSAISTDAFVEKAIRAHYGLRITKSEPWEAALCFTVSQFNNIKRIRGIMGRLIDRFGEAREGGGRKFRLFPNPAAIAGADARELMRCGAGYRAAYLKSVAKCFAEDSGLEQLYEKDYDSSKRELLGIHGIGDKVADCILLFGYGKLGAFPVDTWIKRPVEHTYFDGKKKSVPEIHAFADGKWGPYAGYAQQYLFWHGRSTAVGKSK